jgi:glycosyltransferase involved in cell wall biosynthesis
MKPRLLVVPHIYADDICIREIEFARRLAERFDVYCLKWADALHVDGGASGRRRWKQLSTALRAVFTRRALRPGSDGITYVEAPVLQPVLLHRAVGSQRAHALCRLFNGRVLDRVVAACGINHTLLASDGFRLPRSRGVRAFYDVVDWFPEEILPAQHLKGLRSRLRSMARQCQGVFAVSEPLCDKLKVEYGIDAVPMPNGADLKRLRSIDAGAVEALRQRLGLTSRFVIGYIGNHGSFTGVDFVVKVFQEVRRRIPNATLLIVGPADYWRSLLERMRSHGVIWTGPVAPSEVAAYFNAIDLGILAQEKSLGTELAFQIKIVEYSACRKFVVSTPLCTWQRLQWPNIFLADLKVEAWVDAICRARDSQWSPAWDALTEPYDWGALARKMAGIMLGSN